MTTTNRPFDHSSDPEPTREDILVGRVSDGEASPHDWAELESIARRDAGVWQRLALAQRAHARLERAVEDRIAIAELVDAPRRVHGDHAGVFTTRWRAYGGWAAAAVVALAWFATVRQHGPGAGPQSPIGTVQTAQLIPAPAPNADELFSKYLDAGKATGRVVGEMPLMMVDARPSTEPGREDAQVVYYIRPVLEQVTTTDMRLGRVSSDEHGRPVFMAAQGTLDALVNQRAPARAD